MRRWNNLRLSLAALPVAILAACSGPSPTRLVTTTDAAKTINPNADGVPRPVVVRVYDLLNRDAFSAAQFTVLYTDDRHVLAADIVDRDEFEIRPGETKIIKTDDAKGAAYVAVLAAFSDVSDAKWRDTASLKPHEANTFAVHVELGSVTIVPKKEPWWVFW